jgi:hypothetical protein
MMLIASLIELPNAKTRICYKHKIQLAKFDKASLRVIWLRCGSIVQWLADFDARQEQNQNNENRNRICTDK